MPRISARGLRWRRQGGVARPIWYADDQAVKAGYLPAAIDLSHLADRPEIARARAAVLNADLRLWQLGYRDDAAGNVGFVRGLLVLYTEHPESGFQRLKPWTQRTYRTLLAGLRVSIGDREITSITGLDLIRWQRDWSADGFHLARGHQMRTALLSATQFGAAVGVAGAVGLLALLRETRRVLPQRRPRDAVLSAAQVIAVRRAAHEDNRPSRALAYAITFEVTLRLFDTIGRWWPFERAPVTDIVNGRGEAWSGLRWEDVDDSLVLRYRPSKTIDSTGIGIVFPLTQAPMVMEELKHWSLKRRSGPMIVNEANGLPYRPSAFQHGWRQDRAIAGIPKDIWARDLRASGISESRSGGVSLDDAAKVAGHAGTKTTGIVYDRAALEAAERFAVARKKVREERS
jgi:integrase